MKIEKMGHRLRILNKLMSEAKNYSEKLKNNSRMKLLGTTGNENNQEACRCIIF